MPKKLPDILFLDIDGVLVNKKIMDDPKTARFIMQTHKMPFDKDCVVFLNEITEKTRAKIVISSSWRFDNPENLKRFLKKQGVRGDIIDRTPLFVEGRVADSRGEEIQDWLDHHDHGKFVIVDDDSDMGDKLSEFFVKTEFDSGLTEKDAKKAIEILKR